ncbi:MAG: hypothetical protein HS101_16135 [Planctomycetia bacterium]|jgi:hypothetical protein|nr:hypothetical protein [Planctomycetia bacterium]MCC7315123.1 hypothetical protein [Planctomycetota bacterium]OQY96233.1 MAG: hypothetical protein B6D36_19615 [Planctomycetes bacterium UTPLA1]
MIRGKFEIVGGLGEIVEQNIRAIDPGEIGFELLEVKLRFDANGEAQARIPYVSGQPSMWAVKLGTGGDAPALPFNIDVTGKFGQLVGLPLPGNIASAADVAGDITPAAITLTNVGNRPCGEINIAASNSGVANAGKTFTVALQLMLPVRTLTA